MTKICCGGFNLGEGLELDGRTLKATGGSSPVPDPEVADIGKVLGIVEDGAGAKYAPVEGSDSGLPDPSTLSDGTAMVAVNGEWKMQEGYGYTGDAFEPITWDGNTEGRDAIPFDTVDGVRFAYKVSDIVFTTNMLDGATLVTNTGYSDGVDEIIGTNSFLYATSLVEDTRVALISGSTGEYSVMGITVVVPSDGTYFTYLDGVYITSLTAPTVHQFDSALIPTSGGVMVVNVEAVTDGDTSLTITADKTVSEIMSAFREGIVPVANTFINGSYFASCSCIVGSIDTVYFGLSIVDGNVHYSLIGDGSGDTDRWDAFLSDL